VVGLLASMVAIPASAQESPARALAEGKLGVAHITVGDSTRALPAPSGGLVDAARFGASPDETRQEEADAPNSSDIQQLSISQGTLGCRARNTDGNVRVNQDCTFRRQAEESIKINPTDPNNLIAGQNDSRIGFNHCGFDYSLDGGQHWGDGLPPYFQHLNNPTAPHSITDMPGTFHTYDAASDPAVAFDSAGRAFYSCVVFDLATAASGVFVTQAPKGADGSFYDTVPELGTAFVAVEDDDPLILHDKEFIAADQFAQSPNRDNVYVTWTVFKFSPNCLNGTPTAPAQCESPIYGSMSTDHGVTWSAPEEISGNNPAVCFVGNLLNPALSPSKCDFNQGSDPQPLPNGKLAVVFNNGNTPAGNPNGQQLAVVCSPSGDSVAGTAHLNCGTPSKVGDDILLGEPQCNFGRGPEECVPGPWIRTNDFPRIGLDTGNNNLYAVWQDYRNHEYDIQISRSKDGGKTWKEGGTVNPAHGADHYFAAVDVGTDHQVAVSYYRSDRVPNENDTPSAGFTPGQEPGVQQKQSSYILAGKQQPDRDTDTPFAAVRISPFFPPPDGIQAGFNGDYSGIAVRGTTAHPIWSDTRNSAVQTSPSQGVVHDEDVFTDSRSIPDQGNEN